MKVIFIEILIMLLIHKHCWQKINQEENIVYLCNCTGWINENIESGKNEIVG